MHLNTEKVTSPRSNFVSGANFLIFIQLILSLKSPVGVGAVQLEWQTHDGSLWAATGSNRTVHIFDHYGNQKAVISMPGYT